MSTRLAQDFFAQDTISVARHLLGQRLVHRLGDGTRLSGRIIETEAYLGVADPAAHSFGDRRTPRTEVMFGRAGLSYVYFIYGMHFCLNVVTGAEKIPEAVLLRALDPIEGIEHMKTQKAQKSIHHLANGPGKLCAAMKLNRSHNGIDFVHSEILWLEKDGAAADVDIVEGPRVGIGQIHDAVHWPLRYGLKNHPALSPPKFPNYLE